VATTYKPVAALTACVGSKFEMSCTPEATYLKFDQATGMAFAQGPKDLKAVAIHKCLLK
jgi:hypothetical protein